MDITPLINRGQKVIQSYDHGKFTINGNPYTGAVAVFPDRVIKWDVNIKSADIKNAEDYMLTGLNMSDFNIPEQNICNIDVVLLGTGEKQKFLPKDLKQELKKGSIHIETMDTGAACRTYNVLMAEGRRVAALLLPYI